MRHIYSKEEKQFLIDNVKGISLIELTERFNKKFSLNVSINAIQNQKTKLKLRSGIVGGQFQKGLIPYNKGKRWDEYMLKKGQANSRKTTFKKGNIPANYRAIGSERTGKDGYILVKIQDGHLTKNWMPKHRYIYESVHGKIPNGYKVIFADGNIRNFDLENLLLVSNSEELIMNQNKLIKKDKDITKTGVLIAKVIDKTNKLKR